MRCGAIYNVGQKHLRLNAHAFCLYLQNALTNFRDFWHTSTPFNFKHVCWFHICKIHHTVALCFNRHLGDVIWVSISGSQKQDPFFSLNLGDGRKDRLGLTGCCRCLVISGQGIVGRKAITPSGSGSWLHCFGASSMHPAHALCWIHHPSGGSSRFFSEWPDVKLTPL